MQEDVEDIAMASEYESQILDLYETTKRRNSAQTRQKQEVETMEVLLDQVKDGRAHQEWLRQQLDEAKAGRDVLENEAAKLVAENAELRQAVMVAEAQAREAMETIVESQQAVSDAERGVAHREAKEAEMRKTIASLEHKLASMNKVTRDEADGVERMLGMINDLETKNSKLMADRTKLRRRVAEAEKEKTRAVKKANEQAATDVAEEIKARDEHIERLAAGLNATMTKFKAQRESCLEWKTYAEDMARAADDTARGEAAARQELEGAQQTASGLAEELEMARGREAAMETEVAAVRQRLQHQEDEVIGAGHRMAEAERVRGQALETVERTEHEVRAMADRVEQVSSQLAEERAARSRVEAGVADLEMKHRETVADLHGKVRVLESQLAVAARRAQQAESIGDSLNVVELVAQADRLVEETARDARDGVYEEEAETGEQALPE